MRQQVNLLAPMFRKQPALFGARVSLAILGVVVVALALIYAAAGWRNAALAAEQARLEQRRDEITAQLGQLASQLQGQAQSPEMAAAVQALTVERDRKAQALAALSRRELGNTRGFSPHFVGLARQTVQGLWLTRIEMGASGTQLALQGVALSEELLPLYLKKLGAEDVFTGTQFEHAQLERIHEGGNQLRFELRTKTLTTTARATP